MILFIICFAVFFPTEIAAKNALPVFITAPSIIFNTSEIIKDADPFDVIGTSKFEEIFHSVIKFCDIVLLFIEETFNVEDVSSKDRNGSPFVNLRLSLLEGNTRYFPSVVDPFKMLTQYFQQQQYNTLHLRSALPLTLADKKKYLFIYFDDFDNETRTERLRRHDSIIHSVYNDIGRNKTTPVVAFYTGKTNPLAIGKMHFVPIKPIPIPKDLGVMVVSSGALFRFSGVYAATATRRSMFNQLPLIAAETLTRRTMSTRMAYVDFELEFNFSFKEHSWRLDDVVLMEAGEEVGRTKMDIEAPWNMSYVCGEPMVIVNLRDGSIVSISSYQIQPRMRSFHSKLKVSQDNLSDVLEDYELRDDDDPIGGQVTFGKSTNCGPYFNIPILTCLFVTTICSTLLVYGFSAMASIKSNSRFEDPLGKTLSGGTEN